MPYSESSKKARYKYEKKNIKRIPLDVQISFYEEVLKPAAERSGEKVNEYIKKAILMRMEQDGPSND